MLLYRFENSGYLLERDVSAIRLPYCCRRTTPVAHECTTYSTLILQYTCHLMPMTTDFVNDFKQKITCLSGFG